MDPIVALVDEDPTPAAAMDGGQQSMVAITSKNFISGIAGGACEAVAGYPLETVKARMQTQGNGGAGSRAFSGPIDCLQKSIKEGGVSSLYRGASPQVFRSAIR